jgi:ribonucleoside-diphosphate reductase alpha chain
MWSPAAQDLIRRRYTQANLEEDGGEGWLRSVANHICQLYDEPERRQRAEAYLELMLSRRFFPTSAVLANAGRLSYGLAGCCVLSLSPKPREPGVETLTSMSDVLMAGAGVGLDATPIPPRAMSIETAGKLSPGPVEALFSSVREAATVIGERSVKPAAFMGSLLVDHPDIFDFIAAKACQPLPWINLSVAIDGAFQEALARDGWLLLNWQRGDERVPFTRRDLAQMTDAASRHGLRPPDLQLGDRDEVFSSTVGAVVGRAIGDLVFVRAQSVLEAMAFYAHASGDPGFLDLDAINAFNPTHRRFSADGDDAPGIGTLRTTAPCGEKPLLDGESCFLGSINLAAFVQPNGFDFAALDTAAELAVRFLDDVIDISEARGLLSKEAKANRKIGLGMMGLADTLSALGVPYDDERGRDTAAEIAATLQSAAVRTSQELAREKGAFSNWPRSRFAQSGTLRRNATVTGIAPTGHISRLAGCSASIEPHFRLFEISAGGPPSMIHPLLQQQLAAIGYSLEAWISATPSGAVVAGSLAELAEEATDSESLNQCLRRIKQAFPTALDISPTAHIAMTARLQEFVESAISKTINLLTTASVQDVRKIFEQAMDARLRGVTVYRAGSLQGSPVDSSQKA